MHSTKTLFSALHLLVVLFVLSLGLFLYFTPTFAHFEIFLRNIVENPFLLRLVGGGVFALGMGLCFGFYKLYQGSFYQVKMQSAGASASVDVAVVEKYMQEYLEKEFLGKVILHEVLCKDNKKFEIKAEFPYEDFAKQKEMLQKMEKDFRAFLQTHLGYKEELIFTVLVSE